MSDNERVGAIDAWGSLIPPEAAENWSDEFRHIFRRYGCDERMEGGMTVEQMVAEMDEAGVDMVLLSAFEGGGVSVSNDFVSETAARFPERFKPVCTVDPRKAMEAVREFERCVKELGCVGLRLEPYNYGNGFHGLPPNDKLFYPLYAKACELNVPVVLQVGHTGPLLPSECGRPIYLDEVALTFPELTLVGAHLGQPWHEEMMTLAWKFPNVYIETSARRARYWPKSFIEFCSSWGRDKVLWATDYPLIDFKTATDEVYDLGFSDEVNSKVLRENTLRAFELE